VKTFFDNPTPNTVLAQNPALRSLDFPLIVIIGITEREREREKKPAHQKVTKQILSDYAQQD
jgi:hypothetical protein